jgi:hypothetical protein
MVSGRRPGPSRRARQRSTMARVAVLVFVALFLIGIALAYGGLAVTPGPTPS